MVATSYYQIMVKRIISKDASAKIGPFGFAYLNVMSVPFLVAAAKHDFDQTQARFLGQRVQHPQVMGVRLG